MRGALFLELGFQFGRRIIPADAGSTGSRYTWVPDTKDHPRGCGEHDNYNDCSDSVTGSSPRMRGARGVAMVGHPTGGIIPADAGSTVSLDDLRAMVADHPRGCGEHFSFFSV